MQTEHRTHLIGAEKLELPQTTPLLDPAKHLLDAPAGVDRLRVALMAGGAPIDGRTSSVADVLRHVRTYGDPTHFGIKASGVVVLAAPMVFWLAPGRSAAIPWAASLSPVPVACVTLQ